MRGLIQFAKRLLAFTPYEVRRRLAPPTIDAVKLLLAYYCAGNRMRTLVQIGAADGSVNDPICRFVQTDRFRAILVEPIPSMYAKLSASYAACKNVMLVQAAIAETDGSARMFRVRADERWAESDIIPYLSSFDRKHIESFGIDPKDIEEVTVPALSLASLAAKYELKQIDLLQVDAEGYDAEIVKMALKLPQPPRCINFERVNLEFRPMTELFAALEKRGYHLLHDAWNTLAVHESVEKELAEILPG